MLIEGQQITEALFNPVTGTVSLVGASGFIWYVLRRFVRNDERVSQLDGANDKILNRQDAEIIRLGVRCDILDGEKDRYFRETVSLAAQILVLQGQVLALEREKKQVDDRASQLLLENQNLHTDYLRLEQESVDLREEIAQLQAKVRILEAEACTRVLHVEAERDLRQVHIKAENALASNLRGAGPDSDV